MRKFLPFLLMIFAGWQLTYGQPNAWINEIHYDNDGSDINEGIEVVLETAGSYTLSDFGVTLYNGNGGAAYGSVTLDQFTEGVTVNGYTIYYYYYSGIQNGAPDGLCLSYQSTPILGQFLSYEGSFTATDGPANGLTSMDIGVSESSTDPAGNSLQLSGTGSYYGDFTWQTITPANFGSQNNGQSIIASTGDVTPPVWTSGYPKAVNIRDNKGTVVVNMDEPGKAYAIVIFDGGTDPSSLDVKSGMNYDTVHVLVYDSVDVLEANTDYSIILPGASPETAYDVWVVAQDDEAIPNLQAAPVKLDVTTTAARSLTITAPVASESYNLGDSLVIRWTAANIDSLFIGAYDYQENDTSIIFEDNGIPIAIPVSPDSVKIRIPHEAGAGNYDIILWDAADTSYYSSAGPITVVDNRSLNWVEPVSGSTWYVGDTVTFKWNALNIDSIYIGGYDYSDSSDFWLLEDGDGNPVAMTIPPDSMVFPIPLEASTDSVRLTIFDAEDTSFYDMADPVYLVDTIKPRLYATVPENGQTDVPLSFSPVLLFNEAVDAVGNVYLFKSDGTPVDTFNVDSAMHDWGAYYWEPTMILEPGTQYYFTADPDIFVDNQGNVFSGLTTSTEWSFTTASAQPYFSEYVEGSSNNKALEIYNPTNQTIDLSTYALLSTFNGGGFDWNPYPLSGMLDPGDVYVIVNPDFDFSLLADSAAVVDTIWGNPATWFNGNDARGLAQLVGGSWDSMTVYSVIDVIGNDWEDPGSGWDVAGVSAATKDHTLLRKSSVMMGNIAQGWNTSAGTDEASSEWKVFDQNFVTNLGLPTPNASDATEITGLKLYDTTGILVSKMVTIDSAAATVDVEILFGYGTQADSLVPQFTLSAGATSLPASGDTVDFSAPATVTVTAEDQITTRDWTVTVTEAASASTETNITSFVLAEQTGPAVIDTTSHTVTVEVAYGTDLTTLTPTIEVSAGATIAPASGAVTDFTNPVTYTVTAQDGTTTQDWTVTVTAFQPAVVTIYDIQYTTDPSGDSPYKGQMIQTSGVVTALNIYQSSFKGYFLQDTASAWNGVYVYDPDHDQVQIGDSVTLVADVDEYYNLTELKNVASLVVETTGVTLPGPVALTTGEASAEMWEGVFVSFTDATCTANDLGHAEVSVDDGTGELIVDDFLYNYDAAADFAVNNIYDLTGVMNYSFGAYKLNPRSADDISDVTGIHLPTADWKVSVYPNPSDGRFILEINGMNGELQISVMNLLGKVVSDRTLSGNETRTTLDLSDQPSGIYFLRISDGNNTRVERMVIR